MVESQIANLTFDPSFSHTLCFRYPNGSCELILDIYVLRAFQWYKKLFNLMCFDPCNGPLKIWEFITTSTLKMGVHLGVWGFIFSHSCILGSMKCDSWARSWPAPLQTLALIASPRVRLWYTHWTSLCVRPFSCIVVFYGGFSFLYSTFPYGYMIRSISIVHFTFNHFVFQFPPHLLWGINFISTKFIASTAYMKGWAFIAPIITVRFLSNHPPFLLKVIDTNSFGPLPF